MGPAGGGVPPRTSLLPLLFLLLLVLAAGHGSTVADRVVERLKDGFDYYYKITGYALGDAEDYQLAPVHSACECRRWCQVSTKCNSVSVVKVAGGRVVECRVSHKPTDLRNTNDRPRLNKTQGAIHFLSTDKQTWEEEKLGQTGVKLWNIDVDTGFQNCENYCPMVCTWPPCSMAVLNTWALLEDAVALIKTDWSLTYVNLVRAGVGEPDVWGPGWGMPSILHSASEINRTTLHGTDENTGKSEYTFAHDGHSFTFAKKDIFWDVSCACMENPLNLEL